MKFTHDNQPGNTRPIIKQNPIQGIKTHTPALSPVINETRCTQGKYWGSVHHTVFILLTPGWKVKYKCTNERVVFLKFR